MNHSKRPYVRIVEFDLTQGRYAKNCEACGRSTVPLSRFTYAMQQVAKQLPKIHTKWGQEAQDIDHKLCETKETDGKGPIIYDDRGKLMFTKTNETKRSEMKHAESEKERWDIVPYYVNLKSIPDGLTEQELDNFEGFIIRHKDVVAIRAKREAEFGSENSDVEDPDEQPVAQAPAADPGPGGLGLDESEENQS